MSFLQLILKQMRQRSLSTWLTLLSVFLGVTLAISIMILYREGGNLFGQRNYGYDVVVGAKGAKLQLVLNTVYHMDVSPGNIPYSLYRQMTDGPANANDYRRYIKWGVPMAVGDNYQGYRVVGTQLNMFGLDEHGRPLPENMAFEYRIGKRFAFAQGQAFDPNKFQAVIGSEVARRTGLKMNGSFQVEHGEVSSGGRDVHPQKWRVVGILQPTQTANDRILFLPLKSFFAISGHTEGLKDIGALERRLGGTTQAATQSAAPVPAGEVGGDESDSETIHLALPESEWKLSAILVRARAPTVVQGAMWVINNGSKDAMAANPATEMTQFFKTFLEPYLWLLLAITVLVTVVAGVSILVSIYNSVSARIREIAILRALGATRTRILALICMEAGLIGLVGGVLGWVVAHVAVGSATSMVLRSMVGQGINWMSFDRDEGLYLLGVVVLAVLAGLVPALKAYRTPVATNLVAA